jgi:adenosylmethionine-8-amino-7-oxononanoate aminotransferase
MGLMVRPIGHLNVMSPPLVITEGDVDFVATTLAKAITQVADRFVKEGIRIG